MLLILAHALNSSLVNTLSLQFVDSFFTPLTIKQLTILISTHYDFQGYLFLYTKSQSIKAPHTITRASAQ